MKTSRRSLLKGAAVLLGLAAVPWTRPAAAQGKVAKTAMKYQDHPNNGQQCSSCLQFIPGAKPGAPGTCKVVDGDISPKGWCIAYAKKA
ncbi:MAG TPA: high-potential iron-sulfur protein [Burkholderiales bacterium]|nr:high-potential iron-sulfur protein [Burkholderiales bacterium]